MFSVRVDKKAWSKEAIDLTDFENRGFKVVDSRRGDADKDVFLDHRLVAKLFINRCDALKYIETN